MQGMLNVFKSTRPSKDATAAGQLLAEQGLRLTASDVVWDDFPQAVGDRARGRGDRRRLGAGVELRRERAAVHGQLDERDLAADPRRLDRRHARGGARVIACLRAQPGQGTLTDNETTIQVSTGLAFEVGVTNSGDLREVSVKVTPTIPKQPNPIVKNATIDLVDLGTTKAVTFRDFGEVPIGEPVNVQVAVLACRRRTRRTTAPSSSGSSSLAAP